MRSASILLAAAITLGSWSCAGFAQGADASPSAPIQSAHWLRAELYFGIGPPHSGHSSAAQKRWQAFLDREVTPRFPDGFTVLDADGQWRAPNAAQAQREGSRVLVIVFEDGPAPRRALDEIREAWKRATGDRSVLSVIAPAEVSF